MSFWGYPRPDGAVGTRNYVGVISTVACVNDVAQWIAKQVPGCALFAHQQGVVRPNLTRKRYVAPYQPCGLVHQIP